MPLSALALVIFAGLIHAIWNIAAKKAQGDARFAAFTALLGMVLWAPLGIWLGWDVVPGWGLSEWGLLFASGVVHVLYYITLLRGYRHSDLTVVYPMARGTGPLLSSVAAIFLLGEAITFAGLIGIAAVVAGVFSIAGGPSLFRAAHDPDKRSRIYTGMGHGVLTGVFIAGYTLIDGYGVKVLMMGPILVDYFGNVVRVMLFAPLLRDRAMLKEMWRTQLRYALIIAIISPVGYVMVLYAMQLAPLSHVAPAREVSMLFAALLGGRLLGEGDRVLRICGAACIAFGVMALALS